MKFERSFNYPTAIQPDNTFPTGKLVSGEGTIRKPTERATCLGLRV